MLNDPLFPSSYAYAYYDHHHPMSLDDLYYDGNRLSTYPFTHNFPTQTRLVPLERMGRQQIAQAHAQRAFEEQERRRQQYQMEQELLRIKMARQRRVAMERREEEERRRRRCCQEQYHKMLLKEQKRQILKKERERLMAEKEAEELAEHIRFNSITRKGHEYEDDEPSKRYQIIQGPGGALYQVASCLPDTEEYYSDGSNDEEDWGVFVRRDLRRDNKPKVRFVQKASAAPPRKETSTRRMPKFHTVFDRQEEKLHNEQQQPSRKMNRIPILNKVPTKMTSSARTMMNEPTVESKVQVESKVNTNRVKTTNHLNEEKIINSSSEVVFGEVEDASDDEMEDSNSIWTNRRPSEGKWMEPIVGFEY